MTGSKNTRATLLRRLKTRTRLDENFDSMRLTLARKGITLEIALAQLKKNKEERTKTAGES